MLLFLNLQGLSGKLYEFLTSVLQGFESLHRQDLVCIIVEDLTYRGKFLGDRLHYFLSYHTSLEGTQGVEDS
jgi:hypothetical protein